MAILLFSKSATYARMVLSYVPTRFTNRLYHMTRVASVGFVGFSIQTIFFEIIGLQLNLMRPSTAALLGGEIGILTNFFLNNRYNFTRLTHTPILGRLVRFHTVVVGSLVIQWIFLRLAEDAGFGAMGLRITYLVAVFVGFLSNYTGYTLWVWRKKSSSSEL